MQSKIYYIANIRIPTEKAHGVQIMKTCEAFSNQGQSVELVATKRTTGIKDDPFQYYGVKRNFKITKLWCLDTVHWGWFGFWMESVTFAKRVGLYVLFKKGIFYTRDEFLVFCLKVIGKKVVWEAHMGQKNIFTKFLIWQKVSVVAISQGLKNLYVSTGVDPNNILVAHDAVDVEQFDIDLSQEGARKELNLPLDKKLVVYTGSRQPWKGVGTLEEAGELLPASIEILVVSNKSHTDIPKYLKSADILVIPNTARQKISASYTSPMKLFEYMTSEVPIVASDLPSMREVLDESMAYFFIPDDVDSLASTINKVLSEPAVAQRKAGKAKEEVKKYTWRKRAENIMEFIR